MAWDEEKGFVEVPKIKNLYIEWLVKRPEPRRWLCRQCGQSMRLFPHNKDLPAEKWVDRHCGREISLALHDQTWEDARKLLMSKYNLMTFTYDRTRDGWGIHSNEWVSSMDRLDSQRKRLTDSQKELIKEDLLDMVADALQIDFDTAKEYWLQ